MGGLRRVSGLVNGAILFAVPGRQYYWMRQLHTHSYLLTRYSLLPAITCDGYIHAHIKKGGYNGEEFCSWLEGLMPHMRPYPAPRSVLVIDNCRIHHVAEVEEICEAR